MQNNFGEIVFWWWAPYCSVFLWYWQRCEILLLFLGITADWPCLNESHFWVRVVINRVVVLQKDVAENPIILWISFSELFIRRSETQSTTTSLANFLHVWAWRQVEPLATIVLPKSSIVIQEDLYGWQLGEACALASWCGSWWVLSLRITALNTVIA